MDISIKELASYRISDDGTSVVLEMKDEGGTTRALRFKIAELGCLVTTLPGVIESALRRQYQDTSLRYAYPIGSWAIEETSDPSSMIVTLRTKDGFSVSFSMTRAEAAELGRSTAACATVRRMTLAH